jgi:hypothetical protein
MRELGVLYDNKCEIQNLVEPFGSVKHTWTSLSADFYCIRGETFWMSGPSHKSDLDDIMV